MQKNNLVRSIATVGVEYVSKEKGFYETKKVSHSPQEVLQYFKHHLKRLNRYRLSLVKPYVAAAIPSLKKAA